MAYNFITVPIKDLGAGVDLLSAENAIPEGFSEQLYNTDPTADGYLRKRTGYQGKAGGIPVRVESVSQAGSELVFTLDGSIDLRDTRSSPLVVYGHTSAATAGDFSTTDGARYYSSFSPQIRKTFAASSTSSVTVTSEEHGIASDKLFVGVAQSTSETVNDNALLLPDSVSVDSSSFDVTVSYTNGNSSDIDTFVYYLDKSAVAGETYVSSPTAGATSQAITTGTHGLSTTNIVGRCFADSGTALEEITPESFTVASNGDCTFTFSSAPSGNVVYILTALDTTNTVTGSSPAGETTTVAIENLDSPFLFVYCFLESGTDKVQVFPSSVTVNAETSEASVAFENNSGSDATFTILYEYGDLTANRLVVTAATSATWSDDEPQLTIWGLLHSELYPDSTASRPGWATHIDSYRAVGESRLVVGLGGNLFDNRPRSEVGTSYLLPLLYPNLRARVSSSTVIAPAFIDNTDTSSRTRGHLSFDGAGEGWASVTAIAWDGATEWVKLTLSCPNLAITGTLGTAISATSGLEDELTVEQSGWSVHNGTFKIKQVTNPSADTLYIWVENDAVDSADWDDTNSGARAGVFTDRIATSSNTPYLPGDGVTSSLFGDDEAYEAVRASGTTTVIRGVTEERAVPLGLQLVGNRTSSVIPLRTLTGTASVSNLVRGDNLTLIEVNDEGELATAKRQLTVRYINALADRTVSISGDGETAVATLGSGDTSDLTIGQKVILARAGVYTGTVEITDIPSATSFEFASEETEEAVAGTLQGYTAQIDEELDWVDGTNSEYYFEVPERWIPIEAPSDSWNQSPSTTFRHFDSNAYAEQPYLRSAMAADNLFLTNGDDEVQKYDGTNITRAGLFRWQAQCFTAVDTGATAEIDLSTRLASATVGAVNGFVFRVNIGDVLNFRTGDIIVHSDDGARYTVADTTDDATYGYVTVDRSISGAAAGTITTRAVYRYYARLNAVDANQNVIASATVGSDDLRVELSASAAVTLRFIGPPAWGNLDFDRIELEVYRTALNGQAPFYRIATLTPQWNNGEGYIEFTDSVSDDTLRDLDPVNTALLGQEIGTQFSHPLRAKYITSANNKLVLANLKSDPTLDIRLVYTGTNITPAELDQKKLIFRRDNTDSSSVTDNVNRMAFEFVDAAPGTVNSVSSAATYFEVTTSAAHNLSVGHWVYLFHASTTGSNRGRFSGWFQVNAVPTGTTFRVLSSKNATYDGALDVNRWTVATTKTDVPVYLGDDGNFRHLNGNPSTSGAYEQAAAFRLSCAINAAMRNVDVSLTGQETFEPWMTAGGGGSFNVGQIVITQPRTEATTLEVELPSFSSFAIAVNGILRASAASVSALTVLYPSRLIASCANYPEIFDSPTEANDSLSPSAIDVNPSDGQQITGVIPFFGDSAFGGSQKASILVVFKDNSIYLVDLAAKAAGLPCIQKIDSQGLGCTAPYSIAPTAEGIMFANQSGLYRLDSSLKVKYIGQKLQRYWRETVDRDQLSLAQGHYYANGNQYKLSLPVSGDEACSEVAVYDTTRESRPDGFAFGSWTLYDAHPATGWANLGNDAFFSSTGGRVFSVRRTGDNTDYRDDGSAISMDAMLRALDFGDDSLRKLVSHATLMFRVRGDTSGTTVSAARDLSEDFQELDDFEIQDAGSSSDGLGSSARTKVQKVTFSLYQRRLNHLQLRIQNNTIDEPVEISAVSFRVAGLADQPNQEAADSTRS
jgi:outer membrane lipoprotein SlyB